MLHLLIDENFDQRILRGLRLVVPLLDYIVVQETKLKGLRDPHLLAWAAENQRILVTHDVNTIPRYASERVRASESQPTLVWRDCHSRWTWRSGKRLKNSQR